ncbi:aminopeptidase P family protein [Dysgonomonas sp. 216]|uniref:aminopeptidase P family protein n=1 Tax=Dysgonomonas sp. 216 TaxID=2302934 RepID=UPI0013CFEDFC|nr:aminopeptidase P family protein [Dysgonomonas sp. 216]NDW17416.1 aminopeptidase P family protein [Dysgonomonas sp. 216]
MSNKIHQRLVALRKFMEDKGMHAFIVPSTDAHLSEYPALHWASREWISGFTGSAGTAVITREKASLWTDSRYFLQAANELEGSGFELQREGLPHTPSIEQWLVSELGEGEYVGIDGSVYAAKDAFNLTHKLNQHNIHLISDYDPFDAIWHDRPQIPQNPIFIHPEEHSGLSVSKKIKAVCEKLEENYADSLLVASLDTIAWIFNIRGNDVEYNPVAVSFAYISKAETILFIDPKKMTDEASKYLQGEGVILAEYNKVYDFVSGLQNKTICVTGNKITFALYNKISSSCRILDITPSPADLMKSIKNETEIKGFRNALTRDGVALVKFFMWLEKAVPKGEVSELGIVNKLIEYRSQQAMFVGESFGAIVGYLANGAIVHYHVTPETSAQVKPEGVLLIDSGAQYFDGTTDITRTVAVGKLTEDMKRDYTMVLKGHIGIASCRYPQGTRGSQIDVLARKALWNEGMNYLHGTGHGIGHFLNVHEGPQSIRMDENPVTLQPGMVTSNEPGIYKAGQYGIRIENLILTKEDITTEFGNFYAFETLTLCPIDTTPVVKSMLSKDEIKWLNDYHEMVYDRLESFLDVEEKVWLKEKTKAI